MDKWVEVARVGVDEVDGIVQRIHIGSAEHRTYGEDEF